ncbi:hypothetical protein C0J52_03064, partial [Blattella germanica]
EHKGSSASLPLAYIYFRRYIGHSVSTHPLSYLSEHLHILSSSSHIALVCVSSGN